MYVNLREKGYTLTIKQIQMYVYPGVNKWKTNCDNS